MSAVKITDGVYAVGALNPGLRVFDIVMSTEFGTTYNSYLVCGKEKTALIEGCHKSYFDRFLENIQEVCDPAKIDVIVLNHNEPDHTGAVAELLKLCPQAEIYCSVPGAKYITGIINRTDVALHPVKDGDTLDLGGKTLQFISAPFLHWPDSMFTFLLEDKIVFSCDFLGSHYCEPYTFDRCITHQTSYQSALKGYYDAIFGPFPSYVQKGLEKLRALDVETVCCSHGPVLTKAGMLSYAMEQYDLWSRPVVRTQKCVPVFYCSAYGNTAAIAAAIQEGIRETLPDAECECYDIIEHDMASLAALLNCSDGFAIGSPTLNRDAVPPVWILLSHVDAVNCAKRPALVFGSYGWSGEAVGNVKARLEGLKMKVFDDGFKVVFVPTEEDLARAKALGSAFAQSL